MTRRVVSWSLFASLALILGSIPAVAREKALPARLPQDEAAGRGTVQPSAKSPIDLAGQWKLLLPAGWEKEVTIEPLHEGRFYLAANALSGTFEVSGNRLRFLGKERLDPVAADAAADVADAAKKPDAYQWQVYSSFLMTLVEQPERRPADYLGAVLFRSNGVAPHVPGTPVTSVDLKRPDPDAPQPIRHGALSMLNVAVEPSEEVWVDDQGNIAMKLTIRNDSPFPIWIEPPLPMVGERGAPVNAAVFEKGGDDGAELDPRTMHRLTVMLDKAGFDEINESLRLTLAPEESRTYVAFLEWTRIGRDLPVDGEGRCTLRVSLTFVADGKSQHVLSPAGRVVTLKPVAPAPSESR